MVAMEAALVPESEFVGIRLRKRAARLIGAGPDETDALVRKIRSLYEFRSKIVHGAPLSEQSRTSLSNEWGSFESLIRAVLVEALRVLPSNDEERTAVLKRIYDVDDNQRAEKVKQDFRSIDDAEIRARLIGEMSSR
jgi:hypothetical protein